MKTRLALALTIISGGYISTSHAEEAYCREFTKDIIVGGEVQEGYGTACLQPDGDWKIVKEAGSPQTIIQKQAPQVIVKEKVVYVEKKVNRMEYPYPVRISWNERLGHRPIHSYKIKNKHMGSYKHSYRFH